MRSVVTLRIADASLEHRGRRVWTSVQGVGGDGPVPWTIMRGADLPDATRPRLASGQRVRRRGRIGVEPGDTRRPSARPATAEGESLPPVRFRVAGIADFPFDDGEEPQRGNDC